VEIVKNKNNEIKVITKKAKGKKCPLCWKLKIKRCNRAQCGLVNES